MLLRLWEGAKALIIPASWKCKLIPKLEEINLDELTDPEIMNLLIWVGLRVKEHVESLDATPKNS